MFTGIIEGLGTVVAVDGGTDCARLTVEGPPLVDVCAGDSVCVNGVCLTAVDPRPGRIHADVMAETLRRTTLGALRPGDRVNLERAATLSTRLGGHLVQGHVDGVGRVTRRTPGRDWEVVAVALPPGLTRYVVEQGSIALDGVSLTVVSVDGDELTVSLIPETLRRTTLGVRAAGDPVNVEVDVLGKYVERLLAARMEAS